MSIKENLSITDNFLELGEFYKIRDEVDHFNFSWHYNTMVVQEDESGPGYFSHHAYGEDVPASPFFFKLNHIINQLNPIVLFRIRLNLNTRLPQPHISDFHTDIDEKDLKYFASQWATSIFYINTNNGYTELETGEKIESVANRLVTFPLSTRHRFVTQTDKQTRLLINFAYLKCTTHI